MSDANVQQDFTAAVDTLVEQVKHDRAILAAVLCGSLSHDVVWEKSDVDLVLVTVDDKKIEDSGRALYADGVNVHVLLLPRSEFRKTVEGTVHNSFMHSFLAKGRLLYTHDPTIADLCASLQKLGDRDRRLQLLRAATHVMPMLYKARKWLITRGDLEYASVWILYAATALARIEVMSAGRLADREVLPQALELNPQLFRTIYTDLLNTKKTRRAVEHALEAIEEYMGDRATELFAPVLEYLEDAGEARSATDIESHFARQFDIHDATTACEYLADRGLVGKASIATRLTKKSTADVQELAFFPLDPARYGR